MEHCIHTLLAGGDEVEILIVDDGSAKDRTAEIADEYERKYPGICGLSIRRIRGTAGGEHRTCQCHRIFFKVVDSDDWVNEEAYRQVLETLGRFVYRGDTLICW